MYQNQKWKDTDDQTGLFTYYVEQQTRQIEERNKAQIGLSHPQEEAQTKQSLKLRKVNQRYTTNYSSWKITKGFQKKQSKHLKRGNLSESKNPENKIKKQKYTEFVSSQKNGNQGKSKKSQSKSEIQLKKRNLNECFGFDISKSKSRMFIFRGEPVRLIKRTYKDVSDEISANKKSQSKKSQAYQSLSNLKQENRAINSDIDKHPKIKLRYNFVQFLNERKKRQKEGRLKQSSRNRNDVRLSNLLSFNKPQARYLRSQTER